MPKGYKSAVEFIANEDDPTNRRLDEIDGTLTVALAADIFEKRTSDVAADVLRARVRAHQLKLDYASFVPKGRTK